MKIWYGFGSEHSARLVMIGHFQTPEDAEQVLRDFEELRSVIVQDTDHDRMDDNPWAWYRNSHLTEHLRQIDLFYLSPEDIEHFTRDCSTNRNGSEIEIQTDEDDINGLLKFLLHKGAHVQVYSAHSFPSGRPGRG